MKREARGHLAVLLFILVTLLTSVTLTPSSTYAATKTHFSYSHVDLVVGSSYKPKLISSGGKTIKSSDISWKSSMKSVVKVSTSGKITGKNVGKAKIFATYKNKTYSFSVQVYKYNEKKVKEQLGIPSNIKIKVYRGGVYYWDSVGIWLVSISVKWEGEYIASADFAVKNSKIARQIDINIPPEFRH